MKQILLPETLRRFKKLIMALLKFELKIEQISLKLAKLNNFAYSEFFQLIDPEDKGYFCYNDLKNVFNEHKIGITAKELSFLFERLDCKEKDQKITYDEFIKEVQPHLPKNLISTRFTLKQQQKQNKSMANVFNAGLDIQSRGDINSQDNMSINNLSQMPLANE